MGLALVTPAVVLIVVFFAIPLVLAGWMSLHTWPLLGQIRFTGFDNYVEAFSDRMFGQSLVFTLTYTLIITPVNLIVGYLLAMLVRQRFRGVGFFRTTYFAPVVVGFAASAYIFLTMVQPEVGIIEQFTKAIGIGYLRWQNDPALATALAVVLVTWKSVGTTMVLFMAMMQSIPEELYESAQLDGAGWWTREARITIPLLRRTVALVVVLLVTGGFLAFEQFYILTQGGPSGQTTTVVLWLFSTAFVRYRLGYSAALSVLVLLLLLVFTVAQLRALRSREDG